MSTLDAGRRHPILDQETGTLYRRGRREVVLCYPNSYAVAGSSLGFQVAYRKLNARPSLSCQRAVLWATEADRHSDGRPLSLEHGMPLTDFDAILVSMAYELDLVHLFELLDRAGLDVFADKRPADAPPVILGGPITQSNALPLAPFVDVVVMGEADAALDTLASWLDTGVDRAELLRLAADEPGFWVPSLHGDAVPDVLSVQGSAHIPARGVWFSSAAEFRDMALLETSRGCPRYCRFCVVRAPASPMRSPELERVTALLDEPLYAAAPRVGFVGAAVSDWPPIKEAIAAAIDRGKGIGVSSLRADRLDEEFVDLLRAGGYRTLTVASDAPSQRMRGKMMKGLRERHFVAAAEHARRVGMTGLKMYVIVGLPEETDADLDELIDLGQRLSQRVRTAITISPLVPKLHTPLVDAPFAPVAVHRATLERIRRALARRVDVRFDSPRWAWIEYRLSQGGAATGKAAWQAWRDGGSHAAWKRAFAALDRADPGEERGASRAARQHDLWPVAGAR